MAVSVVRGVASFPDRLATTLKYSETRTLVSVAGALNIFRFSGNNLYDPDYTATGHQPYGFDQYTPFFQRYCVTGSRVKIRCISDGVAANVCLSSEPLMPGGVVPTSTSAAVERPRTSYGIASGVVPLTLSNGSTAEHMFGVRKALLISSNDFSAAVTQSPAKEWYYTIFMDSVDLSTTVTLYVTIEVEYDAVFYERTQVGSS